MRFYHAETVKILAKNDVNVIDYGIVVSNAEAFDAAGKMNADGLDLLFCNMITYSPRFFIRLKGRE